MRPTKERIEQIRGIHAFTAFPVESPLAVRDELLAEIDALNLEIHDREVVIYDLVEQRDQLTEAVNENRDRITPKDARFLREVNRPQSTGEKAVDEAWERAK
jgi:hypothetical protein